MGIRNFRDLAIYQNQEGKHLKKGLFLRSAALTGLKDREIRFLNRFRPLTVIDLRVPSEIVEKPDHQFDGYETVSLIQDLKAGLSHDTQSDEELIRSLPDMKELYAGLILDDFACDGLKRVFRIICDPERQGSVLWHCTEGKDRCGTISALFLKMMGFSDDVIMEDYLRSSVTANRKGRKLYFLIRVFKKDKVLAETVRYAYSVRPEFLQAMYDAVKKRYGDFDSFFDTIGVTKEVREDMRTRFLQ